MVLTDSFIKVRERLINKILDIPSDTILNPITAPKGSFNSVEIAAEVKRAVNTFKAIASHSQGYQIDYQQISRSQAYEDFRNLCTPTLKQIDLDGLNSRQEKLSFWINLYNALVIDAVIFFGIKQSITETWLGVFAFFRRSAYQIAGQRFSLEEIEHGILRANRGHPYLPGPQFSSSDPRLQWVVSPIDARIHYTLNCASRSCPPIGIYSGKHLDEQLDLSARSFVDTNVRVIPNDCMLSVSAIFRWYQKDFGGRDGLITHIINHLPDDERRKFLANHQNSIKFKYQPYDWGLNLAA